MGTVLIFICRSCSYLTGSTLMCLHDLLMWIDLRIAKWFESSHKGFCRKYNWRINTSYSPEYTSLVHYNLREIGVSVGLSGSITLDRVSRAKLDGATRGDGIYFITVACHMIHGLHINSAAPINHTRKLICCKHRSHIIKLTIIMSQCCKPYCLFYRSKMRNHVEKRSVRMKIKHIISC
jgi:hypothetical protein